MYKKIFNDKLYEMSNFFPEDTGVPFTIWITTKSGREKHNARIKISTSDGEAVVMIWGKPVVKEWSGKIHITGKPWKALEKFILLNQEALLSHWAGEISSAQLAKKIKKI